MTAGHDPYATTSAPATGHPDVEGRSVGELVGQLTTDLSTLMRQELALARAELTAEASKAGRGAGLLGGAGVAGLLLLTFASLTVMFALGNAMDLVWAALIVTAGWGIAAAALAATGRQQLKSVSPRPDQTIQTLKEDARWAKNPHS